MPGFSSVTGQDAVMYADNVSFDGTARGGVINAPGQLMIGAATAPHVRINTLTPGPGVSITNTDGNIQIASTGGSFTWTSVTSADNPVSLMGENGYIANGVGQVVFVLPPSASVGAYFAIVGTGNTWTIEQNAMQTIVLGAETTSAGVTGSLTATYVRDSIEMICTVANKEFQITNVQGNPEFA
jgi:hypothetical protein